MLDSLLYKFLKNLSGLTAAAIAGTAAAAGVDPSFVYSSLALVGALLAGQSVSEALDQTDDNAKLTDRLNNLLKTTDDLVTVVRRLAGGQEVVAEFDRGRAAQVLELLNANELRLTELQESQHSATIYAANWLGEQQERLGDHLEAEIDRLGEAIDAHAKESRENHALTHAGIADLKAMIGDALAEKTAGQTPSFTPEQIAAADELLRRGDAKERANAALIKRDFDTFRKHLAEALKPAISEAVELLTLQGDGLYYQHMYDDAVEPYEKAWRHQPDEYVTRNNLALALGQTYRRPRGADRQRAINLFKTILRKLQSGTPRWAATQNNLAVAWANLPTADRSENLRNAIACYQRALEVYTRAAHPVDWATAQNNLGAAWANLPTGERHENLRTAIESYRQVLKVRTRAAHPVDWADTQINLGGAWRTLPTGDRDENLHKAMECCQRALEVYTYEAHPVKWAMTQNNLGLAWASLPTGDRCENLRMAIECYQQALEVYARAAYPADWAMTQNNLGLAWASLPTGDRWENLRMAIECYQQALEVYTRRAHPVEWAITQNNLGNAYLFLPSGDRSDVIGKALRCFQEALKIRTREAHPVDWAATQINLGNAWLCLPTGNRCENLRTAIASFHKALEVYTRAAHPFDWAKTQNNLGEAWRTMPPGNRGESLRKAIKCYQRAMEVWTAEAFPHYHALAMKTLGLAREELATLDEP